MRQLTSFSALLAVQCGFLSTVAMAQDAQRVYAVTTESGTYLVRESGPGSEGGGGPRDIRWSYNTGFAIPQTLGISPASDSVWVGEDLNAEALERHLISGDGSVADSYSFLNADFTAVSCAQNADRAAILYRLNNELFLSVHRSDLDAPEWTYTFSEEYRSSDYAGVKVSRDGSTVAAMAVNPDSPGTSTLHVFEGATGAIRSTWTFAGYAGPIDLDDTGSLCLVTQGSSGRLIRTSDGVQTFSAPGSGGGSRHKISGDGQTLVLGGFSFQAYRWNGSTYALRINFTAPTSWFGWGAAVSRDGLTVGAMSHDYASGYLNTATRIWDIQTQALLGTYPTTGSGTLQDSISGGVLSDDGSIFAVSSWGAADNNHPEVMVFNRNVELIGSVDTRGSVFSLDMTGSGLHVVSGNKGAHANTFGNGGDVILFQTSNCLVGDLDCDCSVGLNDLTAFLSAFGSNEGDPNYIEAADIVHDGIINLNDLTAFLSNFGSICD